MVKFIAPIAVITTILWALGVDHAESALMAVALTVILPLTTAAIGVVAIIYQSARQMLTVRKTHG